MGRKVDVNNLVGVTEIAERLNVDRTTVHGWRRYDGFPEPVATLKNALVFEWTAVNAWARLHGFPHDGPGRPPLDT